MSLVVSAPQATVAGRKDVDYFMNAVFVVFEVEGVLFRVPTYALVSESDVFAEKFALPLDNNNTNAKGSSKGSSAQNPIKLDAGVKSQDFKCLLKLLYPLKPFSPTANPSLTKDEWLSALTLSTKWNFLNIRKAALQALQKMRRTPIEKITVGRSLKISKWVLEGYQELANIDDTTSITDEQATAIGWETAAKLHQIREARLRSTKNTTAFNFTTPISPSTPSSSTTPMFSFSNRKDEKSVEDVFKDELASIRSEELVNLF